MKTIENIVTNGYTKVETRGRDTVSLEYCIVSAEQREGFYLNELSHFGLYKDNGVELILPNRL